MIMHKTGKSEIISYNNEIAMLYHFEAYYINEKPLKHRRNVVCFN